MDQRRRESSPVAQAALEAALHRLLGHLELSIKEAYIMLESTKGICPDCKDRECDRTGKPCKALEKLVSRRGRGRSVKAFSLKDGVENFSVEQGRRPDIRTETLAGFAECGHRLTPKQRVLVQLYYGDGLDESEIAAKLGRSAGSVSEMLTRTRKVLEQYRREMREERRERHGDSDEDHGLMPAFAR